MKSQVIDLVNPLWQEILQQLRHDIYQLPEYISLEAKRTTGLPEAIAISDGEKIFFIPYLIFQCQEDIFDLKSPYGYPGILLSQAATKSPEFINRAWTEFKQILVEKKVCSVFLRMHPILNENFDQILSPNTVTLNGQTVSIDLRIPESQLWSHTRKGHKSTINKCKKLGMEADFVPIDEYLDEFTAIYQETMARVRATDRYYSFDRNYYEQMSQALGEKLHLCIVKYENEIACAGLYTEVCGIVQSTLGGTKDKFVNLSPSSLETDCARYWAHQRGNEFLHLGGGVGGEIDPVYSFKAGFSKLRHDFHTIRLIINPEKYHYLVHLRAKELNSDPDQLYRSNFFPVYRATV